jgi:hypothetical protein
MARRRATGKSNRSGDGKKLSALRPILSSRAQHISGLSFSQGEAASDN